MTAYKKLLSYENIPPYIEMFYKNSHEFAENVYTSTELFNKSKDYAKTVYSSSNFTVTTFGKALKEMFGEFAKKINVIIKYSFKSLTINKMNEFLYKNNEGYYRYINSYDEKKVISFGADKTIKCDTSALDV